MPLLNHWMLVSTGSTKHLLGNVQGHVSIRPNAYIKTAPLQPFDQTVAEGQTVRTEDGSFTLGPPLGRT